MSVFKIIRLPQPGCPVRVTYILLVPSCDSSVGSAEREASGFGLKMGGECSFAVCQENMLRIISYL